MGNLLAFLIKYYRILLFLLLQTISLYMVVSLNAFQNSMLFDFTNDIAGSFYSYYDNVNQYFSLLENNNKLQQENARLRSELFNAKYADTARKRIITDSIYKQKFSFTPAQVINNSVVSKNNYVTLDIGENKGVVKHSGVACPQGIVGITRNVSSHFSTVLSVLHSEFSVSAEIKEIKTVGSVAWDGKSPDEVILKDIPIQSKAKKGQLVITSAYSASFPYGTPIGRIKSVEIGETFFRIRVKLFADMRNLKQVYIVNNIMKAEQEQVEQKSKKEEK